MLVSLPVPICPRMMTKDTQHVNRLLSVQSHVVHGYVGNRAATFPLQLRGWDVDVFNTVQFSNHPAYGQFQGTRSTAEELLDIHQGLGNIGTEYDAILTGYIPGDEGLSAIGDICIDICRKNNKTKWVLDPVLGDNGRIYVSEGNIEIYKSLLRAGYVYLVTPNQLELEVLSGVKVTNLESLKAAILEFDRLYPTIENLVVTSVSFIDDADHLYSAGFNKLQDGSSKSFFFKIPTIKASFSGSGDLFSALLASSLLKYLEKFEGTPNSTTPLPDLPLVVALNETASIVEKVLLLSYEYEVESYKSKNEPLPTPLKINDLKLIQAREYYTKEITTYKEQLL